MFFSMEVTPPSGADAFLQVAMYFALFIAAISHVIKLWLPKPPMEQQLYGLERRIMERLDEQDEAATERISILRNHIDFEIANVHKRLDIHVKELAHLEGFVKGRDSRS